LSPALRSLLAAGLVREARDGPGGPSYGAFYFEPVPDAALVLGLDLGARFLRGASCDLGGSIRVRQEVGRPEADAERALAAATALHDSLVAATGLSADLIDGVVVGVPAVVERLSGTLQLADNVPGLGGRRVGAQVGGAPGRRLVVDDDINLAA